MSARFSISGDSGERQARPLFRPGQLLMRVDENAVRPAIRAISLRFNEEHAKTLPAHVQAPIEYLRKNAGLKEVTPLFSSKAAQLERTRVSVSDRRSLSILSSIVDSSSERLAGLVMLTVDPKKDTQSLARHLQGSASVIFAEPMPTRWLVARPVADPKINLQWGLRAIRWFNARFSPKAPVKVGVLDTGVDKEHPDLEGVIDNYFHSGLKHDDLLGHGTHVCGIIAARANNKEGIAGVAATMDCTLSVWKIFADIPDTRAGDFYVDGERYLRALAQVPAEGVKVVNLSIGGEATSQTEAILFRRLQDEGVFVCAAMGNEFEDGNPIEYPAAYDGVFAVGSIGESLRRSVFSNTGKHLKLMAPGSNILSTLPTKRSPFRDPDEVDYTSWSGTSMATPHVVGGAASILAAAPTMQVGQVRLRLCRTAQRLKAMKGRTRTDDYGSGLLDLEKALKGI